MQQPGTNENDSALNDVESSPELTPQPVPGFDTKAFTDKLKSVIGRSESGNKYLQSVNQDGAMGRYQFTRGRLDTLGYGGVSNTDFINNPALQDQVFDAHTKDNINTFEKKGWINDNTNPADVAGLLMAAHLGGVGGVQKMLDGTGNPADRNGTSVSAYFNRGRAAFLDSQPMDVVSNGLYGAPSSTIPSLTSRGLHTPSNLVGADVPPPSVWDTFFNKGPFSDPMGTDDNDPAPLSYLQTAMNPESNPSSGSWKDNFVDFGNAVKSAYNETMTLNRPSGLENFVADRVQQVQDKLDAAGVKIQLLPFGYGVDKYIPFENNLSDIQDSFNKNMQRVQQQYPGLDLGVKDYDDLLKQSQGDAQQIQQQAMDARSKLGGVSGFLADTIGSTGAYIRDSKSLLGLASMGTVGGLGAGAIAARAAIGGTAEALLQPEVQETRGKLGFDSGLGEAAKSVAGVAAGSAVGDLAIKGIGAAVQKFGSGIWDHIAQALGKAPKEDASAPMIAADATMADNLVKSNPYQDMATLDKGLDTTERQIISDQPIRPDPEVQAQLKDSPPPPDQQGLQLLLTDQRIPEAEIKEAGKQSTKFTQDFNARGVEAQQGPQIRDDIMGISDFKKDMVANPDGPPVPEVTSGDIANTVNSVLPLKAPTTDLTAGLSGGGFDPATDGSYTSLRQWFKDPSIRDGSAYGDVYDAANSLVEKQAEHGDTNLLANPQAANDLAKSTTIYDTDKNGNVAQKTLQDVVDGSKDAEQASGEFDDCIGRQSTPEVPTE